ncbi:hypothetical protein ACTXGQ_01790 [Marinobacter sp. 1Y8]
MERVIFTSGSIFHLQQLESHFRRRGGRHFHLADDDERLALLRETSHSRDQVIQKHFRHLWANLDNDVIDALIDEGGVSEPANSEQVFLARH